MILHLERQFSGNSLKIYLYRVEEKNKNEEDAQNNDLLINKQLIHKKIVNLR